MELDIKMIDELADSLVESHERLLEDLIAMRKKHKLSQTVVAERMGVSQPTVAAFERYDANPTLSTLRRYALAVNAMIKTQIEDNCRRCDSDSFYDVVSGSGSNWTQQKSATSWGSWTQALNEKHSYIG